MPNPTAKLKYKWQTGGNSCNTYNRLMVNSLTNQQGKNGRAKEKHTKNIKIKQAKETTNTETEGNISVFLIKKQIKVEPHFSCIKLTE